jgi:hypothetical protein
MYFMTIPLFVIGGVWMISACRKMEPSRKNGAAVIILWFVAAGASGLITNYANINRLNAVMYPILFFIGYAIYRIFDRLKVTIIPMVLVFSIMFFSFGHAYFYGDFSRNLGKEFYRGFVESLLYVKELEYDKLYVTAKSQGDDAAFTSEIITQFVLELGPQYTVGNVLPEGETLRYDEKYIYSISEETIDELNKHTVYIVREDEMSYFDEDVYEIIIFENYGVVIQRQR